MLGKIIIRRATVQDAIDMAPHLRDCDVLELSRASDKAPQDLLKSSVEESLKDGYAMAAVTAEGLVVSLFGVGNLPAFPDRKVGVIWLLGHKELTKYPREFAKWSRTYCRQWQQEYDQLFNFVDADNTTSRAWLKWLGFHETHQVPYGPKGAPFVHFEYRK